MSLRRHDAHEMTIVVVAMASCMAGLLYQASGRAMPEPVRHPVADGITVHQSGEWTVYEYQDGRYSECRFVAGRPEQTPVCTERAP